MKTLLAVLLAFLGGDRAPQKLEWKVDGATREALVYLPAARAGAPVVFGFHGHGGSMQNASRSFQIHEHWPEALVVYMQGLPTPGALTDPEGKKAGWQRTQGDQGDRDLKFFDAVLATLREKHKIDSGRVYAMGHSNGGAFTYLLWAARGDVFAAVAPSSAPAARSLMALKPLPALHVAGEKDELVKFEVQKRTIDAVRKLNRCDLEGKAWGTNAVFYSSTTGTPFVAVVHPGGHKYYADASPLIVRFFKEHSRVKK